VEQALLLRSARLEPVPASARAARRLVRQALTEVDDESALFAAELAVSELVTNAVLHAATPVDLTIEITVDAITVSVRDLSPRLPAQRQPGETSTTGRGLALVAAVSDDFGVEPHRPTGKTVWFRLIRAPREH
jgi:anti-sigma regulatory factor (Ser/Thr protein kinase)